MSSINTKLTDASSRIVQKRMEERQEAKRRRLSGAKRLFARTLLFGTIIHYLGFVHGIGVAIVTGYLYLNKIYCSFEYPAIAFLLAWPSLLYAILFQIVRKLYLLHCLNEARDHDKNGV
jgi:hypothetical protein